MIRNSREIAWINAALKDFRAFPQGAQLEILRALTAAAEGRVSADAKPLKGIGPGVFEVALRHRSDAFRAVYATKIDDAIWVLHAFKKKSKTGIKTPKREIDLVRQRLKRLRETLT